MSGYNQAMTELSQNSQSDNFHTTRWSLVEQAGNECERALESLCSSYWYPLYAYASRRMDRDAAQDATQAFFAILLEKNYVESADQTKGKFRAFLLTAFKRFLSNRRDHEQALKRGGGVRKLSLDFESAESGCSFQPADDMTPEKVFERQWVLTLLQNVIERLKEYYTQKSPDALKRFELLKHHMLGEPVSDYATVSKELGMKPEAVRVHVHRMRQKYRDTLREEVASTVEDEADIADEIRKLFEILN